MNLLLTQIEDHTVILDALRQKQQVDFQKESFFRGFPANAKKDRVIRGMIGVLIVLLSVLAWSVYHSDRPPADLPTSQVSPGNSPATPKPTQDIRCEEPSTSYSVFRKSDNQQTNEVSAADVDSRGSIEINIKPNNGNNSVSAKKIKADGNISIGVLESSDSKVSK